MTPVDGPALQGLIQRDQLVNIRSSSTAVADPRASAVAAIDGDRGTTWVADPGDERPSLSLTWLGGAPSAGSTSVSIARLRRSRATSVVLEYPGGRQQVELDDDGVARVEPFRARRVDICLEAERTTDNLTPSGDREPLGIGVSELRVHGLGLLPISLSTHPTDLGCEFGPTLRIGIGLYPTSVAASPRDLFSGGLLPATLCGPAELAVGAGATRVVLSPAPAFRGAAGHHAEPVPPGPVAGPPR